jgi:hypothetical protein
VKIPSRVKIGGIKYDVIQTTETLTINFRECCGTIDYESAEIKLNTNRNPQKVCQTFWHEVFHAIVKERNLSLENISEETLVDEMAIAMNQIIVDNPNLFNREDEE